MPIYEAMCDECGKDEDYYQSMDTCHITPWCCGKSMRKVILSASMIQGDLPSYKSPIDGKWVDGRKKRHEDLKRNGCRPYEGFAQESKEASKQQQYTEQKLDASLTKAASEAFHQLPPSKRDILRKI